MRELYEVLGLSRDASASDIKKAYRSMAMKYHPDRNPGDHDAEEKFKECSTAYQVLADEEQRERYDRFGFDGLRGTGGSGNGFSNVEDIFSAFGDLFGDFFGGGRGRGGRREVRGNDLRVDLKLSFAEAVWGVQKEVKVARDVPCETCKGSGAKTGSKPETCGTCGGKGQVVHAQGFFMVQTVCPRCRGEGKIIKDPCETCNGRRVQQQTSALTITVPPGVDDGTRLRLGGKGEAAIGGGTAGDLYVVLHVVGDERWKRDGDDVYTEAPVSFVKAALGGEVEIYTLDDHCDGKATIEIKPGTQPGDLITRRGHGIPRLSGPGRGDHVVALKVEIPEKLSAKAEELMRELAAELDETVKEPKKGLFARLKK